MYYPNSFHPFFGGGFLSFASVEKPAMWQQPSSQTFVRGIFLGTHTILLPNSLTNMEDRAKPISQSRYKVEIQFLQDAAARLSVTSKMTNTIPEPSCSASTLRRLCTVETFVFQVYR
jgi:hypothetical protein